MRQLKKIYLLVACGLITASSMASSDQLKEQVTTGYKNKLLNNCQLVSEITMTPMQVEAYQKLQQQEASMHQIEVPIKSIERQMHEYTDNEITMTPMQVEAYQKLQQQEASMYQIEVPIKSIERQMHEYTDKIEKFSALAVKETETSLSIDKEVLAQQNEVVHQFEDFMAKHREKFNDLDRHGRNVSLAAKDFEQSIKTLLVGLDYDQVHVVSDEKSGAGFYCYSNSEAL
jgi:chromosome segregation ATPase